MPSGISCFLKTPISSAGGHIYLLNRKYINPGFFLKNQLKFWKKVLKKYILACISIFWQWLEGRRRMVIFKDIALGKALFYKTIKLLLWLQVLELKIFVTWKCVILEFTSLQLTDSTKFKKTNHIQEASDCFTEHPSVQNISSLLEAHESQTEQCSSLPELLEPCN